MLLCCDAINLVKKANKDLKIQRSLTRNRSQTTRDISNGVRRSFSIINHVKKSIDTSIDFDGKKDFTYETDHVNKIAKVKELNRDLLE